MSVDSFRPKLAAHVRRQLDRMTDIPMLLHPEGAVELSESADAIVRLCDGTRSVAEISAALAAEFDAPVDALQPDVDALLAELRARALLAPVENP